MKLFEKIFLWFCFSFTFGVVGITSIYHSFRQSKSDNNWDPNIQTLINRDELDKKFITLEKDGKFIIQGLANDNDVSEIKIPTFVDNNGSKIPVDISKEFIESLQSKKSDVKSLTIGGNVDLELLKVNDKGNYFNKLESLKLEDGIKKIPNNLFVTPSLKEIKLPNSIEIIDSQFFRNTSITEIEIPNTIKELLSQSFAFARKLEKVTFRNVNNEKPSEFVKLGGAIFQETNISSFTFPNNWKNIEFEFTIEDEMFFMFFNCFNLKIIQSSSMIKNKFFEKSAFKLYVDKNKIVWSS